MCEAGKRGMVGSLSALEEESGKSECPKLKNRENLDLTFVQTVVFMIPVLEISGEYTAIKIKT